MKIMIIIIDLMQCKMENNLVSEKKEDAEMFSRGTCTRYHHSALQTVPYGRSSGSEIFEYSQILNSYRKERSHLFLFFHPHTCSHTHTHTHTGIIVVCDSINDPHLHYCLHSKDQQQEVEIAGRQPRWPRIVRTIATP